MEPLNQSVLSDLRDMARRGSHVPPMLRVILERSAPAQPHTVTLIKYLRQAFALTLRQASPVGGWMPDNSGELNDAQLNDLLLPEIMNNRSKWDVSETAATQ
jgi:hypothetical protein